MREVDAETMHGTQSLMSLVVLLMGLVELQEEQDGLVAECRGAEEFVPVAERFAAAVDVEPHASDRGGDSAEIGYHSSQIR